MMNTIVKKTSNPKLIDVTFNEIVLFNEQLKHTVLRAYKIVSALRTLGETEHNNSENMVKLYRCVILQLGYASLVRQTGTCERLEKIQRRGHAACFGVAATAAIEVLDG